MASLSPSKIRAYGRCPLQYKLQCEPWPERQDAPPSPELAVDRIVHDALERFHASLLRGEPLDAERLCAALREAWSPEAFASPEAAAEALELWSSRLRSYVAVQSASAARVAAGKTFCSTTIAWARITSIADRVDRLPGGGLELIDFRSGKPPGPDFNLHRDLGAVLCFLAAGSGPKLQRLGQVQRFTQWFLQNQQRVSAVFGPEDLAWAEEIAAGAAEGIAAGRFPARRGPQCSFCDQLERCPEWPRTPRQISGEDAQTYARRLRLSYSKLSSFKSCPRAYRMSYVEKLQQRDKPFFDLGKAVHETLEVFHGPGWTGGEAVEDLLELYERCFHKHQRGYATDQERERYRLRGRQMLEAYHRRFVQGSGRAVAHKVEEYFELPLGQNAVMTGFIDRIDRDPQGRLTVWDYKTESGQRTQQEVDEDLQLGLYAWACRQLWGEDATLGLFMLAHDAVLTTRRTEAQLAEVEREVDALALRIRDETEFLPTLNQHCPDCDWLADCPLRGQVEAGLASGTLRHAGFADQ